MPGYYKVFGSKGWLEVGTFGYQNLRLRASYTVGVKGSAATNVDETNPEPDPMQFVREIDHFTECILQNKTPKTPGEEGLADMKYIQAIYRAAGISFD